MLFILQSQFSYCVYKKNLRKLDVHNGLSQNTVNTIFEDKYGLIWFGTNDGLNRLDGEKIEVFYSNLYDNCALKSDRIFDLAEDNCNRLWIAAYGSGISYYDYKRNCFKKLEINYKENQDLVQSIFVDTLTNLIWVATDGGGIFSYNYISKRKRNYDYLNENKLKSKQYYIIRKIDNNICVGSSEGEVVTIDSSENISNIYKVSDSKIVGINKYKDKFLIASEADGIFIFDYKINYKYSTFIDEKGKLITKNQVISSINQTGDSSFTVSTQSGILNIELKNDSIFMSSKITQDNYNINYDTFIYSFLDSKGTKWYGSNGYGIYYENEYFDLFKLIKPNKTNPRITFSSIRAINRLDSNLWIGGYGGINLLNLATDSVSNISYGEFLDVNDEWNNEIFTKSIYCFTKDPNDKDILWIGSEGNGLYKYSKKTNKFRFIKIGNEFQIGNNLNSVFNIEIYENSLLLSTTQGIFAFEPKSEIYTHFEYINEKIGRDILHTKSISLDHNTLYAIFDGIGAYAFYLDSNKLIPLRSFFPNYNKSLFKNLNSIKYYNNKILLGSKENGLLILDMLSKKVDKFDINDGLINNCVYEVLSENDSIYWVSTNKGFSKVNIFTKLITNYNSQIFDLNTEFNQNAAFKDNKNNFYFGGVEGLIMFRPELLNKYKTNSKLIIKSVEFNRNNKINYFYFIDNDTIEVEYLDDLVEINLITNEYLLSNPFHLKYRINNSEYINSNNNNIRLFNLNNGLNKVQLVYYNSNNEKQITEFYINVNVPFFKNIWFYFILLLLATILIYLIYNYRIRELKSKQKKTLSALKVSENEKNELFIKFNIIEENCTNVIWQVDKEFNLLFATGNINNYYNVQAEKKISKLSEIYIIEDLIELRKQIESTNSFRKHFETNLFLRKSLNLLDDFSEVKLIKQLDKNGDLESIVGIVKDTKESNKTKKQLIEREELFSTLVGNILEPVLISSWEGEILFANNEAKSILKISENNIPEKKLFDFLEDSLNHELRKKIYIVKTGDTFEKLLFELKIEGKIRTIEGNGTKIIYYGRSVFLFTFRDVTERINLIKELTTAKITAEQTSELKSMYLSNLTHELKTPINAISGFTDILKSKFSDDFHLSYLDAIKSGTNLLLQLINDLLFYTKAESGKLELRPVPTNIKSLILEIERIFEIELKKKNLILETKINNIEIEHLLNIDQLKFKQIIINLLNNAIKYTDEGEIRITINIIKINSNQVNLELIVDDTGIGIPKSKIEEIFTAFRQVNFSDENEGFGLGLAIVKRILDSMNGEINVYSEVGKGSKFVVLIKNINLVLNKSKILTKSEDINIVESFIRKDNKLNIYSKDTLLLAQSLVNGKFSLALKNIKSNFLLKDINDFAEELYNKANELGINFISNYAKELQNATNTIEVEKISNLLENFYKLVEMIDKLLNKISENEQR